MGDHTRKFFHISLSQENKFSFEGESEHFISHIVSKNKKNRQLFNNHVNVDFHVTFFVKCWFESTLFSYFFIGTIKNGLVMAFYNMKNHS